MTEKPTLEESGDILPILSVGEISNALKRTLEGAFPLIRVRGEITGFKRAPSGHFYFRLKDDDAVLDGVCWRGIAERLSLNPQDGMEVVATGRITAYAGRSTYQIVVDRMELAGEGALLKLLEERRRKLAEEGLFDLDKKRELPYLPKVIGVVSSPTGAVIRDILHRLDDRFPSHVLLWPVLVQGAAAADQIAAAIKGFNKLKPGGVVPKPDVLIVARGGGSLEDLMAFNEESVVRAAAASRIPLISAVGHETDTTLIDYAADVRAPTPTAAAEMAVPVRDDLLAQVANNGARLHAAIRRNLGDGRLQVRGLARGLPNLRRVIEDSSQRLDDWAERLGHGLHGGLGSRRARLAAAALPSPARRIDHAGALLVAEIRSLSKAGRRLVADRRTRLAHMGALLDSFSYERVLDRGFALVRDSGGVPVLSAAKIKAGMGLGIRFHDGEVAVTASGKLPAKSKKKKTTAPKGGGAQGSLL